MEAMPAQPEIKLAEKNKEAQQTKDAKVAKQT